MQSILGLVSIVGLVVACSGHSVTFRVEKGRAMYFTGRTTTRKIDVKFDTEPPYHCSEKSECSDPSSTMMTIQNDVTKEPIIISWKGWKDQLSKISRYILAVFKLKKEYDMSYDMSYDLYSSLIPNPVPLYIRVFNETTEEGAHFLTYQPKEPGVYALILEVNDRANNSAYVRRFVIYDPISTVTLDKNFPVCATCNNRQKAESLWQTTNPRTISLLWKRHFLNKLHEDGNFLARVSLFPPFFIEGGDRYGYTKILSKYDDTEGTRSRDAIPNERGIIKYDIAYDFGRNQIKPQIYQFRNYKNSSINISLNQNLEDGESVSFWVKAYDIIGNTKETKFVLHYDSTKPNVSSVQLHINVGEDFMNFTSRILILGAKDPDSGVEKIGFMFRDQNTGLTINQLYFIYPNPARDQSYCSTNPCDSNPLTGMSYGTTIDFLFLNCYAINVSDFATETVTMEIDVYNSAGLFITKQFQIANLTSLRGINDFFGPININISDTFVKSAKIVWSWAPSCYRIQGFQFTYSRDDGLMLQSETVLNKNKNWVILNYVEAGRSYHLQLYTLYGEDPKNPIKSVASNFSFSAPKALQDSESDHQSILYGVIAVLCISFVVIGFLIAWIVRRKRPEVAREVTNARSPADDVMSRPDTYDTADDTCNTTYQELGQISSPSNYNQLMGPNYDQLMGPNYDQLKGPNTESRHDKGTS